VGISLKKGERVSLSKSAPAGLSRVTMGLGWDAARPKGFIGKLFGGGEIDLDASCLLFNARGQIVDQVWFRQLKSADGSVLHTGDNRTGAGEGDDEQIRVDLSRVPAHVQTLLFVVNSFLGQTFNEVENAFCRVVDEHTGKELARYELREQGRHTAQIMAKVYRDGHEWQMEAIGAPASGRTFHDLMPAIRPHL
jgi:tellurium resistance protein TerZ